MRVFYETIGDVKVKIIGDVHLGRRFINGVPLHRRDEREAMVMEQFKRELREVDGARCVIQVGDLFDKFQVSNEILMETWQAISNNRASDVGYYLLRGNHDVANDQTKISSFQILTELVASLEGVFLVDRPTPVLGGNLALVPYDPIIHAEDLVRKLPHDHYEAIFGHWDVVVFGENTQNLIPISALNEKTKLAITGHDHKPRRFGIHGEDGRVCPPDHGDATFQVIVTGSMQPFAHGEEAEGEDMYLTLTLDQVPDLDLKNKCVRLLLQPGEEVPEIDCLQLTVKRASEAGDNPDLNVDIDGFDFVALFDDAFAEVPATITAEMKAKFMEVRNG